MQLETVNILLVDDHSENLLTLRAILDSLGGNLIEAHSGEEALRCLLEQDFAVILLDVQMPGMDGFETAALIRQRPRSQHTPIIFLTAFTTSDTMVVKGYSLGAVDYLLKPIEPAILKSKVAVFIELYQKTAALKRQATQLEESHAEIHQLNAGLDQRVRERTLQLEVTNHQLENEIAERKRTEAEREQLLAREQEARAEAEAANRIKDEFLAVLSHELRTPLSPILGWTRILRSSKLDAAATDRALETIERNAQLQTQLIEELLDVSRILQGKMILDARPVDLASTIEAAVETVRLAANAKSIGIQTAIEPNVGQVLGDPTRLQQVVWNLLSNAIKFTPKAGRVEVRLERIQTSAQIRVSDTGNGIEPEFLPHIFEYFRQADSTTTRLFGGLGLGLAIVRHLVELHGGIVQAASPGEGQGSTFVVQLPLLRSSQEEVRENSTPSSLTPQGESGRIDFHGSSEESSPQLPPESSLSLNGLRVLLVDDEPDNREFLICVLEQYDAVVRAAASGAEALKTILEWQPAILVSDIGMPEMDGYELIRQVRALPLQRGQIPVIALTAYAGEVDRQRALSAGFNQHVAKPVDPDQLVAVVVGLIRDS